MRSRNQTISLTAAFLASLALIAGCGATIKQAEEANPRVAAARDAFGTGFDYMIIEADTNMADAMFVGFFSGPIKSDLSRELFTAMAKSTNEGNAFMVTGAHGEKTAQVILHALIRAPDNSMPDLKLLYLGEEQYVKGIEEAVQRVGGTMQFAPYPGS